MFPLCSIYGVGNKNRKQAPLGRLWIRFMVVAENRGLRAAMLS